MTLPKVLLLCGGKSDEHEVSLASARSVVEATRGRLDVRPLVIAKTGHLLSESDSAKALTTDAPAALSRAPQNGDHLSRFDFRGFDVVFPLLHGPFGEDGTVQGMLELMNLPYVGAGVLGSAVGMDKLMMKAVFAARGLPQVRHAAIRRADWIKDKRAVLARLEEMPLPVFVKPANLGSSVGISRVDHPNEFANAIDEAARLDRRIIVEQAVACARELEVALLGNDDPEASPVGEITYRSVFYDYETKYTEGKAELIIPAEVSAGVAERCQTLALEAFAAIDAAGLARVDFFYVEDKGEILVNEINTMPGFTATSMYPKLWAAAGVSYGDLVARLIELALDAR